MTGQTKAKHTTSAARKARYQSYRALHVREKAKLKRVLQSSGVTAVRLYAERHGLDGLLARMITSRPVVDK